MTIIFRKALKKDLKAIISLLFEDKLGQTREKLSDENLSHYERAFKQIEQDSNQFLIVAESEHVLVGTCHLTLIPSLTFCGSLRLLIEAVRVKKEYRSQQIGEKIMQEAIEYAKLKKASIIQLTCNKERDQAIKFYKRLGFTPSHVGFKKYL